MRDINPPEFSDLTPREIGALSEGCGVPEFDPPELWFHDACRFHDFLYWRGGTSQDRHAADAMFYKHMKHQAQRGSTMLSRMWRHTWAWTYFKAVDWFGWIFAENFTGEMKTWDDVYDDVEAYYYANPGKDPERRTRLVTEPQKPHGDE
jgi:hypothetical protein